MNPYSIDAPYEEYDNFASYRIASPKNGLSPALGSQEYSALLDAFTNNANDDYNTGQSMDSPKIYGNHSQSQPGRDQGPGQIRHQGTVGAGPFSSVQAGYSSTGGSVFNTQISPAGTGGLGIHSDPAAATSAQANYNAMYTASHRPNSQTVSHLEALADASPPRVRTSSSYLGNAGPGYSDLASSRLGRQASSQSFLEGPHMSALSLNSPRNSVSGGSSAPSSSQNSPVTPLSAYSQDGLSFQAQQQQRQMATQAYHYAYQEQQYASGQYGPNAQHTAYSPAQTLSMSTPASYSSSGVHEKTQSQLARSQGRMSSAGLMDQIVSSRRAVVSPVSSSATPDAIASSKSRRTSRSVSKSTTPPAPATPARHLVQGNSAAGPSQTMSSAGPHRTPAKRNSLHEGSAQYMTMSGTASTTPKRPGTLRRTASHTPGSTSAEASMTASGLASPADLQGVAQRAQNAAQTAMASAMQPAHKARIAESAGLEFPGMSTGMTRARSSPGLTLLSNPPHSRSHLEPSALSPLSASTSSRKSRSNTFSNLYMSPLGPPRATTSDAAPLPVSFDEALLAADRLTAFLSHQATLIRPDGPDTALSVLGTYEQLQAVGDIKARVVARMSNR